MLSHGAVASKHLERSVVDTVLSEDWARAPVDARTLATLRYLEVLTRSPRSVDETSVQQAVDAGANPGALEQATLMAFLFAYMNRMVDAFGADVSPEQAEVLGKFLETAGSGAELVSRVRPWQRPAGELPKSVLDQLELVRGSEGDAPADLRIAIEADVARRSGAVRERPAELPEAVRRLVDVLAEDAHGVTDAHIDDLRGDWSEEAIYEFIFVAAFGAAVGRLERSWTLLAAF
jgi:alkylhydroperoxidase family enzyme